MTTAEPARTPKAGQAGRAALLSVLLVVQSMAAAFFLIDIAEDIGGWKVLPGQDLHYAIELAAVVTLVVGIALTAVEMRRVMARQARMEQQLRAASGAFHELLEEHFSEWRLTPAERDVALMAIKGFSIAEIADLRQTRTGTVKAQCASVNAKARVSGRPQLLSLFIDELMGDPLSGSVPDSACAGR